MDENKAKKESLLMQDAQEAVAEEYTPEYVTITDTEGTERVFELVDTMPYIPKSGPNAGSLHTYVAIIAPEGEDAGEDDGALIILREVQNEDGSFYEVIEDDDEFAEVGEEFESRLDEIFDFED